MAWVWYALAMALIAIAIGGFAGWCASRKLTRTSLRGWTLCRCGCKRLIYKNDPWDGMHGPGEPLK